MKVLVTGGAGYIGSTIASALEDAGHTPVILDSLIKGQEAFIGERIFYKGDIADRILLEQLFNEQPDIACHHPLCGADCGARVGREPLPLLPGERV